MNFVNIYIYTDNGMALQGIAWNGIRNAHCCVLGRFVAPKMTGATTMSNGRRALLSTSTEAGGKAAFKALSVEEILGLPSNRATRYVYLRTIPLSAQSEYSGNPGEEDDGAMVKEVVGLIEEESSRLIAKHAGTKVCDLRSAVHLHTAALALATYRVCTPTLGAERSTGVIRQAFGIGQSLPAHWITKAALLFTPNRLKAAKRMMENSVEDLGEAFDARVMAEEDDDSVRLVISKYITTPHINYMNLYIIYIIY